MQKIQHALHSLQMPLDLTGSFTTRFTGNPDTEPGTVTTIVYQLELGWTIGSVEYYVGDVGSGRMENNVPIFDYTIGFVFSWNPVTHVAEVKLGRIRIYQDAEEYQSISQNVVDESQQLTGDNRFWAFDCKRFDEAVSVSRTMNAILKDPEASIRITNFTQEEKSMYDHHSYIRLERSYTQCDPNNTDMRKYYRDQIEMRYIHLMCNPAEYQEGAYYYSLDTTVHGPFTTLDDMLRAVNEAKHAAKHQPAVPHMVQVVNGEWVCANTLTLVDGTIIESPYE